jgi:probable F420-dependent oxidoreductase
MALKDKIKFGISLPHRSIDPIDVATIRQVATRAEALGFSDLWVTENTLNHVNCFDPVVILTYAAAVTSKIRVGCSVVVLQIHSPLMVAHQWACLDYVSNGRAILGVGIGRDHHYRQFEVSKEGRVSRFREELELIKALWTEDKVSYDGRFYHLKDEEMWPKPVQKPHPPIWMGVGHPDAVRRTARLADGWMGSGGSRIKDFAASVPILKEALAANGRDAENFPISKRIFMAVDENAAVARRELARWFDDVYFNPPGTEECGLYGTPEQVRERLEEMIGMGANHLMLNPVSCHAEQVEALAEVVGLK